jgi:hypothetical protein
MGAHHFNALFEPSNLGPFSGTKIARKKSRFPDGPFAVQSGPRHPELNRSTERRAEFGALASPKKYWVVWIINRTIACKCGHDYYRKSMLELLQ